MSSLPEKIGVSIEELEGKIRELEVTIAGYRLSSTPEEPDPMFKDLVAKYPHIWLGKFAGQANKANLKIANNNREFAAINQQFRVIKYCLFRLLIICRYITDHYPFDVNDQESGNITNITLRFCHESKSQPHYFISISLPWNRIDLDDDDKITAPIFAELMIRNNNDGRYFCRSDFGLLGSSTNEDSKEQTIDVASINELATILQKLQECDEWYKLGLD